MYSSNLVMSEDEEDVNMNSANDDTFNNNNNEEAGIKFEIYWI